MDDACVHHPETSCVRAGSGSKANEPMELASLEHPKVVNSAYFSPRTGSKILTTCIDNRRAPRTRPSSPELLDEQQYCLLSSRPCSVRLTESCCVHGWKPV